MERTIRRTERPWRVRCSIIYFRWLRRYDRSDSKYISHSTRTCLGHVVRSISHEIRVEDSQAVCDDFKTIYKAMRKENGQKALDTFCDIWKKTYHKVEYLLDEFN